MLDIHVLETNHVAVVLEAHGRIDSATANILGDALTGVIDDGHHRIVLDVAGVDYMSSAGLREIVAALKKVRNSSGDLRLARVTERVNDVLELSGLNTILQIFDSQAEAVSSF